MSKKAPFFSHDMNARHDPKISAMRGVFGAKGYGWFWILVEIMAESDGYQLDCKSKYTYGAYAMQMQCTAEEANEFVVACIEEFELFESDGEHFWSKSLRKRMQYRDTVSEKRAAAAEARWSKQRNDANASEDDANAKQLEDEKMQTDANETKRNKTKQNKIKETKSEYAEKVTLTESEYKKLIEKYGSEEWVKAAIDKLSNYKCSRKTKYTSDYHVLIGWVYEDFTNNKLRLVSGGVNSGHNPSHIPNATTNSEQDLNRFVLRQQG